MSGQYTVGKFGTAIRNARDGRGLTLRTVAKQAGVSLGYLCHLETGVVDNPTIGVVAKLCDFFGLSYDEVLPPLLRRCTVSPRCQLKPHHGGMCDAGS